MTDKKELRKTIRELKRTITPTLACSSSNAVLHHLKGIAAFKESKNILLYSSLPDELDTAAIINACLSQGKDIYLPRVEGDDIVILKANDTHLAIGSYNIYEPTGDNVITDKSIIDVAIIPGMAFDKNGNRLGRGKGYYDRFLSDFKGTKIGLGYDFQLLDSIPTEAHDKCMDWIVTPNAIIETVKK